jgi:uncharacterized Zn finger protein
MAKTAAEMVRGACDRARGRRPLVHFLAITPAGFAVYVVGSSGSVDSAYRVTVKGDAFVCTCAAELRPACWHRAAVASVRASRQAFGMPADGPTAEQAAAAAALAQRCRSADRVRAAAELDAIGALFAA